VPSTRRLAAIAVATAALSVTAACSKRVEDPDVAEARDPRTPRERCRAAFAACAPAVSFSPDADVKRLGVRSLVQLASRLDVPDRLAAESARRLLEIASTADPDQLVEVQGAMEATSYALGRCRCAGFAPEIEKQGVAAAVARRAPSRALRTPEHWAERLLERLRELHALSRRSAELLLGGDAATMEALERERLEAERGLCETVHAAREALAPLGAYAGALDLVYQRRTLEAGEGSAELARRTLEQHEAAPACDAAGP
jgi:hypothetical protein